MAPPAGRGLSRGQHGFEPGRSGRRRGSARASAACRQPGARSGPLSPGPGGERGRKASGAAATTYTRVPSASRISSAVGIVSGGQLRETADRLRALFTSLVHHGARRSAPRPTARPSPQLNLSTASAQPSGRAVRKSSKAASVTAAARSAAGVRPHADMLRAPGRPRRHTPLDGDRDPAHHITCAWVENVRSTV